MWLRAKDQGNTERLLNILQLVKLKSSLVRKLSKAPLKFIIAIV